MAPWPDLIAGLALGFVGGTRGKTFPLAILGGLLIAAGGGVVRDLLDLAGTLYFGVAGTQRGLARGLSPENAALAGTLTALCGGLAFGLLTLGVKHDPPRPAGADIGDESGEASPATHSAP